MDSLHMKRFTPVHAVSFEMFLLGHLGGSTIFDLDMEPRTFCYMQL